MRSYTPEYNENRNKDGHGREIDVANERRNNSSAVHKYCIRIAAATFERAAKRYMQNEMSVILFNSLHVPVRKFAIELKFRNFIT